MDICKNTSKQAALCRYAQSSAINRAAGGNRAGGHGRPATLFTFFPHAGKKNKSFCEFSLDYDD